jgi:hypothetical protein
VLHVPRMGHTATLQGPMGRPCTHPAQPDAGEVTLLCMLVDCMLDAADTDTRRCDQPVPCKMGPAGIALLHGPRMGPCYLSLKVRGQHLPCMPCTTPVWPRTADTYCMHTCIHDVALAHLWVAKWKPWNPGSQSGPCTACKGKAPRGAVRMAEVQ